MPSLSRTALERRQNFGAGKILPKKPTLQGAESSLKILNL
jgi:hypothetical protein